MANLFIRSLARLAAPIVEEAVAQIHRRRLAEADAEGITGLDRVFYPIFGPSRLSPPSEQDRQAGALEPPPSVQEA